MPPDERSRSEQAAVDALVPTSGDRVAAYLSIGTEPGTTALLSALAANGVQVLLPVLLPDRDLDWALAGGGVARAEHGLMEPCGARLGREAIADCSLVVVPALSVARDGARLGRGGGSYDRVLPRTSGWVVALLHDGETVTALPTEPHDHPVDAVVTPRRGLVRLREHAPREEG